MILWHLKNSRHMKNHLISIQFKHRKLRWQLKSVVTMERHLCNYWLTTTTERRKNKIKNLETRYRKWSYSCKSKMAFCLVSSLVDEWMRLWVYLTCFMKRRSTKSISKFNFRLSNRLTELGKCKACFRMQIKSASS